MFEKIPCQQHVQHGGKIPCQQHVQHGGKFSMCVQIFCMFQVFLHVPKFFACSNFLHVHFCNIFSENSCVDMRFPHVNMRLSHVNIDMFSEHACWGKMPCQHAAPFTDGHSCCGHMWPATTQKAVHAVHLSSDLKMVIIIPGRPGEFFLNRKVFVFQPSRHLCAQLAVLAVVTSRA